MNNVSVKYLRSKSKLASEIDKVKDCDKINMITIKDCPSASKALKLLLPDLFTKFQNLRGIVIKIDKEFNAKLVDTPEFYICNRKPFLISLESKENDNFHSIMFWKCVNHLNYLSFANLGEYSEDVCSFIRDFYFDALVQGHSEQSNNCNSCRVQKFPMELTYLVNENGLNILMLAVQDGRIDIIQEMLKLPFDLHYESINSGTVSDIAWNNEFNNILLMLLKANSPFPKNFNDNKASRQVRKFASLGRGMHDAVKAEDYEEIKDIIRKNPNLQYFYNSENESAAAVALKNKSLKYYKLLIENNVIIGPKECFENLSLNDKQYLRRLHDEYSHNLPKKYLMTLILNSLLGFDNQVNSNRLNLIRGAFELLDSIPECSIILQIVGAFKHFKIFFDFNQSSVHRIDPTQNTSSLGMFYFNANIYVGAKELLDPIKKFISIATLIHELCHLAMFIIFKNMARPYALDDLTKMEDFQKILEFCKALRGEPIIDVVFKYDENQQHAELIVRVVQIIVEYQNDQTGKLQQVRKSFHLLFNFYKNEIVPVIQETIPIIEKLVSDTDEITYDQLTFPLKCLIVNCTVNFQGEIVYMRDIVKDENTLRRLNSNQIKEIYDAKNVNLKNYLNIGKKQKINAIFYMERKFLKEEETKKFDDVAEEKIFLLADQAGAGKTMTFKDLTMKLKKANPHMWVTFIDLKHYIRVFEKYTKTINVHSMEKVQSICIEIFEVIDFFEKFVFLNLLENGKVIFLFDGVDEISPVFQEFILNLMLKIKILTNSVLWIATRLQYAHDIEVMFNVTKHTLKPSSKEEEEYYIRKILENNDLKEEKDLKQIMIKIQNVMRILTKNSNTINNLLIIKIITELTLMNTKTNIYLYSMYAAILKKKLEITDSKGEIIGKESYDARCNSKLNIWQIHQIYALKSIFNDNFPHILHDGTAPVSIRKISLLEKWENQKEQWTPETVSRNGILQIFYWNCTYETGEFVHKTFAEFFVAQFLLDNIYEDTSYGLEADQIQILLELFLYIVSKQSSEFSIIIEFLYSYIIADHNNKRRYNKKIKRFFKRDFRNTYFLNNSKLRMINDIKSTVFLTFFFNKDKEIVDDLWQINNKFSKTYLVKQYEQFLPLSLLIRSIKSLEFSYKKRWPEITRFITKSKEEYILETLPEELDFKSENQRRMYDLLRLIKLRWSQADQKFFLRKYVIQIVNEFYLNDIVTKLTFDMLKENFLVPMKTPNAFFNELYLIPVEYSDYILLTFCVKLNKNVILNSSNMFKITWSLFKNVNDYVPRSSTFHWSRITIHNRESEILSIFYITPCFISKHSKKFESLLRIMINNWSSNIEQCEFIEDPEEGTFSTNDEESKHLFVIAKNIFKFISITSDSNLGNLIELK